MIQAAIALVGIVVLLFVIAGPFLPRPEVTIAKMTKAIADAVNGLASKSYVDSEISTTQADQAEIDSEQNTNIASAKTTSEELGKKARLNNDQIIELAQKVNGLSSSVTDLEPRIVQAQRTGTRALAASYRTSFIMSNGKYPDIEDVEKALSPIVAGNMSPKEFEKAIFAKAKEKGWTYLPKPPGVSQEELQQQLNLLKAPLADRIKNVETSLDERIQESSNGQITPETVRGIAGDEAARIVNGASEGINKSLEKKLEKKADITRVETLEGLVGDYSTQLQNHEERITSNQEVIEDLRKRQVLIQKTLLVLVQSKARKDVFWPYVAKLTKAGCTLADLGLTEKSKSGRIKTALGKNSISDFRRELEKRKDKLELSDEEIDNFFR